MADDPLTGVPESCLNGDHKWGQAGECQLCGARKRLERSRRSGGAGVSRHPLADTDYSRELRKLEQQAAEDSR